MDETVGAYIVGISGILLAVGREAWSKFFSSESKSYDALNQQLTERINSQEQRMIKLESRLDEERNFRREEQVKVHVLELYIVALKSELRRHGIEIPAPEMSLPDMFRSQSESDG
jgi:hypothetical protein